MTDAALKISLSNMLDHPQIKGRFIRGTSVMSKPSYLVFARRGLMGLSIRPEGIHPGEHHGKPGTTFLAIRLRSSSVEDLFSQEDAVNGITHFPTTPVKAWPNIDFATIRDSSASTVIGKFIQGNIKNDPDIFTKEMADKKLAKQLTAYLQTLAGPENLTIHHRVLQDYLHAYYSEIFDVLHAKYSIVKGMSTLAADEQVDVFDNMAAKMKKKHDELVKSFQPAEVEDNDELDDEDSDGEDGE